MSVREAAVLLVVGVFSGVWASSKPVHITLTSNWTRTPILLEARYEISASPAFNLYYWRFPHHVQRVSVGRRPVAVLGVSGEDRGSVLSWNRSRLACFLKHLLLSHLHISTLIIFSLTLLSILPGYPSLPLSALIILSLLSPSSPSLSPRCLRGSHGSSRAVAASSGLQLSPTLSLPPRTISCCHHVPTGLYILEKRV